MPFLNVCMNGLQSLRRPSSRSVKMLNGKCWLYCFDGEISKSRSWNYQFKCLDRSKGQRTQWTLPTCWTNAEEVDGLQHSTITLNKNTISCTTVLLLLLLLLLLLIIGLLSCFVKFFFFCMIQWGPNCNGSWFSFHMLYTFHRCILYSSSNSY